MSKTASDRAIDSAKKKRRRFPWMSAEDHQMLVVLEQHDPAAAVAMERLIRSQSDLPDERDHRKHETPECELRSLGTSIDFLTGERIARASHGTGGGRRRRPKAVT